MSDTKIPAKTRLLFLGTAASPTDAVVCITQIDVSESSTSVESQTFCGNDSLPGTKTATITLAAVVLEGPTSGKKSYKAMHDWFAAGTNLYFLIARATPATGDIEQSGQCFINQISTSDTLENPTSFNLTLTVDGDVTVALHA